MRFILQGVYLTPSLPQADRDVSAVNLHSSVELSEAWALLCSHLSLAGGEAAVQGRGGIRAKQSKALWAFVLLWGITGSRNLGRAARGSPGSLAFN